MESASQSQSLSSALSHHHRSLSIVLPNETENCTPLYFLNHFQPTWCFFSLENEMIINCDEISLIWVSFRLFVMFVSVTLLLCKLKHFIPDAVSDGGLPYDQWDMWLHGQREPMVVSRAAQWCPIFSSQYPDAGPRKWPSLVLKTKLLNLECWGWLMR